MEERFVDEKLGVGVRRGGALHYEVEEVRERAEEGAEVGGLESAGGGVVAIEGEGEVCETGEVEGAAGGLTGEV